MRYIYIALFTLLTPIFVFASATTSVEVSTDSYINEINQVRNYGGSQDLFVQSGPSKNKRALIYFNFPTFPDFTEIEKAEVKVYANEIPTTERTYNIGALSSSFVEGNGGEDDSPVGEVNWGNKPESVFLSSTTTPSVKNTFMVFDVTSFVKNVYSGVSENFGFQISDSVENESIENYGNFRPKEYSSASRRPKLEITYKLPVNTISGNVFDDLNTNGFLDSGENVLSSRQLTLSGQVSTTTVTDSSGNFQINSLPNGDYNLCLSLIAKDIQTTPNSNTFCSGKSSANFILDDTSTTTYSTVFGVLNDNIPPAIAEIISPISSTTSNIATTTFSWNPVSDISSPVKYIFSYSTDSSTTTENSFLNPLFTATTTDTSIEVVLNSGLYFFNIKSCDDLDNCSSFSDSKNITIDLVTSTTTSNSSQSQENNQQNNTSSGGQVVSNGPIVGFAGGTSFAPQIPQIITTVSVPEVSQKTVQNENPISQILNSPEVANEGLGVANTQLKNPPLRNFNQGDEQDLKENFSENQGDGSSVVAENQNTNQLASVFSSGNNTNWKLFLVLGIILVLGSIYIFTKN